MTYDGRRAHHSSFSQESGALRDQPTMPTNDENRRIRSQSDAIPRSAYPAQPSAYPQQPLGYQPSAYSSSLPQKQSSVPRPPPSSFIAPDRHAPGGPPQTSSQPIREAVNSAMPSKAADDPELIARVTEQVLRALGGSAYQSQPPSGIPPSFSGDDLSRTILTPPLSETGEPSHRGAAQAAQASKLTDHSPQEPESEAARRYRPEQPPVERWSSASQHASPPARSSGSEQPDAEDETPIEKMWQRLFDEKGEPTERLGQFLRGIAIHLIEDFEPKRSIVVTPSKMLKFFELMALPDEAVPWKGIFSKLSPSTLSHLYRDFGCEHHYVQPTPDDKPSIPSLTPDGFQVFMTYIIQGFPDHEFDRFAQVAKHMPINNASNQKERFPKELPRRLFPRNHDREIRESVENIVYERTGEKVKAVQSKSSQYSPPLSKPAATQTHPSQPAHTIQNPSGPPSSASSRPPPTSSTSQASKAIPNPSGPPPSSRPPPTSAPYQPSTSPPKQSYSNNDERSGSLFESEPKAPVSIERERKPYAAAPGGGKVYEEENLRPDGPRYDAARPDAPRSEGPPRSSGPPRSEYRGEPPRSSGPFPHRSNSTTSSSKPANLEAPDMNGYRHSVRPRSGSQSGPQPRFNSSQRRSPSSHSTTPRANVFTRSETEIPYTYLNSGSNMHRDEDNDLRRFNSHNPEIERRLSPRSHPPPQSQYTGDQYRRHSQPPAPNSDSGRG